jgi:hypothetical protein
MEEEATKSSMDGSGYLKLAYLMALAPEVAIFRKFGLLNVLNLLRQQAELQDLEEKLKDVWKEGGPRLG